TRPMTDVVLPLLSLANQLASSGNEVFLQFDGGWRGAMGYLDRVGFFQLLDGSVVVSPQPPTRSGAEVHAGKNRGVVEIRRIRATLRAGHLDHRDAALAATDLIVELLRRGISRHGRFRGCGLPRCAAHALHFRAVLHLRLPRCRVRLVPGADGYRPAVAFCKE